MQCVRRPIVTVCFLIFCVLSPVHAASMWEKGSHYKELPFPVTTNDASKIEVVEAFWYGCAYCYEFNNDFLPAWEKNLPADVDFRLLPVTFPGWVEHAEAFFAAQELDKLEEMHQPLFDAIQKNPRQYKDKDDFVELFQQHGVSEEAYEKLFEASGFRKISKIDEQVKKADGKTKAYRLSGVPALIVNGKYTISVRDAGGFSNMLKIANYLIAKERDEANVKAAP